MQQWLCGTAIALAVLVGFLGMNLHRGRDAEIAFLLPFAWLGYFSPLVIISLINETLFFGVLVFVYCFVFAFGAWAICSGRTGRAKGTAIYALLGADVSLVFQIIMKQPRPHSLENVLLVRTVVLALSILISRGEKGVNPEGSNPA